MRRHIPGPMLVVLAWLLGVSPLATVAPMARIVATLAHDEIERGYTLLVQAQGEMVSEQREHLSLTPWLPLKKPTKWLATRPRCRP
jgi:hypothetical protein